MTLCANEWSLTCFSLQKCQLTYCIFLAFSTFILGFQQLHICFCIGWVAAFHYPLPPAHWYASCVLQDGVHSGDECNATYVPQVALSGWIACCMCKMWEVVCDLQQDEVSELVMWAVNISCEFWFMELIGRRVMRCGEMSCAWGQWCEWWDIAFDDDIVHPDHQYEVITSLVALSAGAQIPSADLRRQTYTGVMSSCTEGLLASGWSCWTQWETLFVYH